MMQISSVVANGSANFSGLRLFPQSRSLAFSPISRDYPSSLCCKLNVEKLNIRSAYQHGQARRCTTCVVKATTDDVNNGPFPIDFSFLKQELTTHEGRFLCDVLQHHPEWFGAVVFQIIKNLVGKRQGETQSSYRPLYRVIGEVEKDDGETSMEDKMYRLVVKMFVKKGISMLPDLDHMMKPSTRIDFWVNQFRGIHSREAFEMILSHIYERGGQQFTTEDDPISKVGKIKLRDLYAHSVIYGYYLGKVEGMYRHSRAFINSMKKNNMYSFCRGIEKLELTNLKSYVTSMESFATASKDVSMLRKIGKSMPAAAISTIENRTQEIFGKLNKNNNVGSEEDDDTMIPITITGIYILLFEAVTFGIFLFEATRYLDRIDKRNKFFSIPSSAYN